LKVLLYNEDREKEKDEGVRGIKKRKERKIKIF